MTYENLMRLMFSSVADIRLYRLTICSWMSFQPVGGLGYRIFAIKQMNSPLIYLWKLIRRTSSWLGPASLVSSWQKFLAKEQLKYWRKSFLGIIILSIHEVMCFKREKIDFLFLKHDSFQLGQWQKWPSSMIKQFIAMTRVGGEGLLQYPCLVGRWVRKARCMIE